MKRSGLLAAMVLALVALGATAMSVPPVAQEVVARPPGELTLLSQLNGEAVRPFLQDGGLAGFYGGAVGCISYLSAAQFSAGTPGLFAGQTLLLYTTDGGTNVCFEVQDGGVQGHALADGGADTIDAGSGTTCSSSPTDINYGVPMAANTFLSVVLADYHQATTPRLCVSGGSDVVIWRMR